MYRAVLFIKSSSGADEVFYKQILIHEIVCYSLNQNDSLIFVLNKTLKSSLDIERINFFVNSIDVNLEICCGSKLVHADMALKGLLFLMDCFAVLI